MPLLRRLPDVDTCCGCIPDLRTASAIIAVLGIVTSPAVSWTVVRHSYVVRVACFVTTSTSRVDVVDLTLNNIISFGFGANAGLGRSCLSQNPEAKQNIKKFSVLVDPAESPFVLAVRYFGWIVVSADTAFAVISIIFLSTIFRTPSRGLTLSFMIVTFISILLSCIYGVLFVVACMSIGGSIPLFELFFSLFDMAMWLYFILVVNTFRGQIQSQASPS